jgi:hypothetical protein
MSTPISSCPIDAVLDPHNVAPSDDVYTLQRRVRRFLTGVALVGCVSILFTVALAFLQAGQYGGLTFLEAVGELFKSTAYMYVPSALVMYVLVIAYRLPNHFEGSKSVWKLFKVGTFKAWLVCLVAYASANVLAIIVLNTAGLGAVGLISSATSIIAFVAWFVASALYVVLFILESERLHSFLAWYDAHEATCKSCKARG